jgi:hypothetical protein
MLARPCLVPSATALPPVSSTQVLRYRPAAMHQHGAFRSEPVVVHQHGTQRVALTHDA